MKKSKDELMTAIDALAIDDDSKIALMEDVADSIEPEVEQVDNSEEIANLQAEVQLWKEKYKARFLNTEEIKEDEPEVEEPETEEEKEIIDVKEI